MKKKDAKKEWESVAKKYSIPHIRKEYIRKPAILKILGKVKGKKIIDLGCGDGYYSRILARQGAKVTGVDFSRQSIILAKKIEQKNPLSIQYYNTDISALSFLKDNTFDIAIGDMVFVTIPTQKEYINCIKEINRIMKRHGEIIISKGHPGNFFRKKNSRYYKLTYNKEQSYFNSLAPQKIEIIIDGKSAKWTNYHRTLEDFLQPWFQYGFAVIDIMEPKPTMNSLQRFPKHLIDTRRIPTFVIFKLKKVF